MSASKSLKTKDLQVLQSALADLYADVSQATLAERILRFAERLIESHLIFFDHFNSDGIHKGTSWTNAKVTPAPENIEVLQRYAHENPVFVEVVLKKRTDPVMVTDFITTKQFSETNVYKEYYGVLEAMYQMAVALRVSADLILTCIYCRDKRNFSERDRSMLNSAMPHIINVIRSASAFDHLSSALETKESGIVAVDGDGRIQFISQSAERLLKNYLKNECKVDDLLPESLLGWMKQNDQPASEIAPAVSFNIKSADGELTIRLISNNQTLEKTLLLGEKRNLTSKALESLNLTKRETEVLFWMAQGKSDGDIAVLCSISPHTVHKHAQNIYIKLGVETRTAAMLRALETL